MKKLGLPILAALITGAIAAYAGSGSLNYTSSGSSGVRMTTDGTTNCTGSTACNLPNNTIWDSSAGANGLGITANNAAKVEGVGSAGSATGGVVTVQGVTSMTPVQVSQATAANLNATVTQGTSSNLKAQVDPLTIGTWGLAAGSTTTGSAAPTNFQPVGGQYNTSAPTVTNGNVIPFQADASGNLKVNVAAGGGSGGTSLADGGGFTQGTTTFTPIGCIFFNSLSALTNGTAGAAGCTSGRSLHTLDDNSASMLSAIQAGTNTVGSSLGTSVVQLGCNALSATDMTAVSAGQPQYAGCDLTGKLVVQPFAARSQMFRNGGNTTSGSAITVAAGTASVFGYITDWECSNTSATTVTITFSDSASTVIIVPAGGGNNKHLGVPLKSTAVNTAITASPSGGSLSTIYCYAQGYFGP